MLDLILVVLVVCFFAVSFAYAIGCEYLSRGPAASATNRVRGARNVPTKIVGSFGMSTEYLPAAIASVLLAVYLVYALLRPEKF